MKDIIISMHSEGATKDEIGTYLVNEKGCSINEAFKEIKNAGVKFAAKSGWREAIVECFKANSDATLEDLTEAFSKTSLKKPEF